MTFPADEPTLTLSDVRDAARTVGAARGDGARIVKELHLSRLFGAATSAEQRFLAKALAREPALRSRRTRAILQSMLAKPAATPSTSNAGEPPWAASAAEYEGEIVRVLADRRTEDAATWLSLDTARSLGELSRTRARALVDRLREHGAVGVNVVVERDGEQSGPSMLRIDLPSSQAARTSLFRSAASWSRRGGFTPDRDVGQRRLLVILD